MGYDLEIWICESEREACWEQLYETKESEESPSTGWSEIEMTKFPFKKAQPEILREVKLALFGSKITLIVEFEDWKKSPSMFTVEFIVTACVTPTGVPEFFGL